MSEVDPDKDQTSGTMIRYRLLSGVALGIAVAGAALTPDGNETVHFALVALFPLLTLARSIWGFKRPYKFVTGGLAAAAVGAIALFGPTAPLLAALVLAVVWTRRHLGSLAALVVIAGVLGVVGFNLDPAL